MKISNAQPHEFEATVKHICTLCGFPAVPPDKLNVMIYFLKDNHGNNTLEELQSAFSAMAAGRLDEKMDNFKSLTGLSASRILEAYRRQNTKAKGTTNDPPEGRSWATDETREIIRNYNGRIIQFNDEVTRDERDMLMRFWINKHYKTYKENGRDDLLTTGTYDFLMEKGILRIENETLQKLSGDYNIDLMTWRDVKELGRRLKAKEDLQQNSSRSGFRAMMKKTDVKPLEFAEKRAAVAVYFDSLKEEPF